MVYDQQVIEEDAVRKLADTYGISYGKAYFLKELISQNENLTEADMGRLSTMNMEEIAREIAKDSLNLGEFADKAKSPQDAESGNAQRAETIQEAEKSAESSTGSEAEGTDISEETKESVPLRKALLKRKLLQSLRQRPRTEEEIRQGGVKIALCGFMRTAPSTFTLKIMFAGRIRPFLCGTKTEILIPLW